ncbi:MAG: TetR/AcrR family transcriptional regulator [Bacilli bacterium]|nr:TetR/AcrR family transcriptional regulator [Bacilli bacterium]
MNKQALIKETLKRLLETNSLSDITVQKLCKEAGINRQIFYYHYTDIEDVLNDYFLNEKINGLDKANAWPDLVHAILMYARSNRQLILKTLKSKASGAVEAFFFNNLYHKGKKFIERQYGATLEKNDIREVAKLMSDSLSREMARLLSNPSELSIPAIEEDISKTFDGVLDLICLNKQNKRGKKL